MRFKLTILILLFIMMLFSGCNSEPASEDLEEKLKVITTIFPLADIIEQVGGELVEVYYLLPPGASPHTYEPTVEQARLVSEADLFVQVGAGLDDWAADLAVAASPDLVNLNLSDQIALLDFVHYRQADADHDHGTDYHSDSDLNSDHEHGPADPHFWLDPLIVRDNLAPAISANLISLAPQEETSLTDSLEQYQQVLTGLDAHLEVELSRLENRRFITFHSAWRYFAARYDLEEIAVLAHFPGQEPSAGWLVELVELIEDEQIGAIFAEPQFSTALADRIAEESGIPVLLLDPIGGDNLAGRDSYLTLMDYNLQVFIEGLGS